MANSSRSSHTYFSWLLISGGILGLLGLIGLSAIVPHQNDKIALLKAEVDKIESEIALYNRRAQKQ